MRQVLRGAVCLTIGLMAAGCQFQTPDGEALSLKEYDSVTVADVKFENSVSKKEIAPLLKAYLQTDVVASDRWKLADDFDLEAVGKMVEEYATTPGTINGKPVKPAMTREEFAEQHAKTRRKLEPRLGEGKGTRPVTLKVVVTKLRFPENLESITLGSKASMECRAEVHVDGQLRGSTKVIGIAGLPGVPLLPASMVERAATSLIFDKYTRKHVLQLIDETSQDIVDALDRTK